MGSGAPWGGRGGLSLFEPLSRNTTQWVANTQETFISLSYESWTSQTRVPAWSGSGESPLLEGARELCGISSKSTNRVHEAPSS